MADLTYKGITLVEQVLPPTVRATRFWFGAEGVVDLELWSNDDEGEYSGYARVTRPHPRQAGDLRLQAGTSFGSDWVAVLDAACAAFVARGEKPTELKHWRELDIRPQDVAPMNGIVNRPHNEGAGVGIGGGRGSR